MHIHMTVAEDTSRCLTVFSSPLQFRGLFKHHHWSYLYGTTDHTQIDIYKKTSEKTRLQGNKWKKRLL